MPAEIFFSRSLSNFNAHQSIYDRRNLFSIFFAFIKVSPERSRNLVY